MADDRAARRVARIRKWGELTEAHGSDEQAWYAIKASPEWELTYGLYPFGMLDEGRRDLALDLMTDAEVGVDDDGTSTTATEKVEPDLSGRPLPALPTLEAIRLYGEEATAYRVDKETTLSYRQALRVETWVKGGAVWWDAIDRRPRVARGFRFVRKGDGSSATLQLERA
jgi:hypothetical protein